MTNIFASREYFKPFSYPWAFEFFKTQNHIRWTPEEVSLADDVRDWNNVLTEQEKFFCTQNFRSFTQMDIDVADTYITQYLPNFVMPELRMMLLAFSATEAVHIHAYSHLIDTVGMPEIEYRQFLEYEVLRERHEKATNRYIDSHLKQRIILTRSIFGEGLQLFAAFIMLLNFTRFNKMKGMGQIITWSIRDESLHVEGMLKILQAIGNPPDARYTYEQLEEIIEMEDRFIDLAFSMGAMEGLTAEEVKCYIRYIGDLRLNQLGVAPLYGIKECPLEWLPGLLNGVEHANFFETRSTDYSTGTLTGEWPNEYI